MGLYYKEEGEGPVLVLLHGFCESREIWDGIVPPLSAHYKVITPDLPGFGKSEPLATSSLSIKDVGKAVISLLDSLAIKTCVVAGHSLGGYVALAMAEEKPQLMTGLFFFHSTALADDEQKKLNRDRVAEFVGKNGVLPFVETFVPGLFYQKNRLFIDTVYQIAAKTPENTLIAYTKAMRDRPDMTGFLRTFKTPVMFLAGERDTFISVSSLSEQAKASVNGQLRTLAETGHMGMFETPEESVEILMEFSRACFYPMGL